MCTLSFVPRSTGYLLAMNRDERIARGYGFPPDTHRIGYKDAIFPSEENGGTWIGSNQYGITLALLNWNLAGSEQSAQRSRGQIIPYLLAAASSVEISGALIIEEARSYAPFRLIGVIPSEFTILQLSWDGKNLMSRICPWRMRHWFSSSASDESAEELRGDVCSRASRDRNAGSTMWLRQLHRSHENGPGAFSMCVHRERVATLSYTEVLCTPGEISMLHAIGSPCSPRQTSINELPLHPHLPTATLTEQQPRKGADVCQP
jgi:hypothetical protein